MLLGHQPLEKGPPRLPLAGPRLWLGKGMGVPSVPHATPDSQQVQAAGLSQNSQRSKKRSQGKNHRC